MPNLYKILLIVVLSVFSTLNLSASGDVFTNNNTTTLKNLSQKQLNTLNNILVKSGIKNTQFEELLTKICTDENATLLNKITQPNWNTNLTKLSNDLANAPPAFKNKILNNPQLIEAWEIVSHRGFNLRTNSDVIESISKIRTNPKYIDFGLNDNLLGQLKGWGYGVDNGASYAEIITDLDRLLTNCGTNNINITNFNHIIDVLKANNTANTKGIHWIIQNLADDVTTFNNKTIILEFTVPNARGTSSYLDVYCANCFTGNKRLLVEYKYGPNSITKQTIIKQFIERDLFNPDITSINQIQWRLKETGLTKSQLNAWLNTTECRTAIQNLGKNKIAILLNDNTIQQMTKSQAATKLIDHLNIDANYNLIFK